MGSSDCGFCVQEEEELLCGLHSTAFISPCVVLGIGWLVMAGRGWSGDEGCPAVITISRQFDDGTQAITDEITCLS